MFTIGFLVAVIGCFILSWVMNESCDKGIGCVLDEAANRMRISQSVKGAVLSAFASSTPELITVVLAVWRGEFVDVGVGTIAGSALVNAVLGGGVVLVMCLKGKQFITLPKEQVKRDVYSYILLLIYFIGSVKLGMPSRILGLTLVAAYVYHVYYTFKNDPTHEPEYIETGLDKDSVLKLVVRFLVGIIVLLFACHYMIICAAKIGGVLGVPTIVMSLVVLAFSTSIADIALSVRDGKNGHVAAGLASCVTSNYFDIAFTLGMAMAITGVPILMDIIAWYTMGFVFVAMLIVAKFFSGKMTRQHGKVLIGIYAGFVVSLFVLFS